ncbi:hypothetical protein BpHYR1_018580 [Brachionus plicatilis]|uniref:Uncharacterized protein n=1 Tax=Brachionus plicatilis TaxID=10195 RepID=A0A3M7QI63_BRAPC|nr:hypothetical protein BpHYR1_018580 [Brachionus plicatilis]
MFIYSIFLYSLKFSSFHCQLSHFFIQINCSKNYPSITFSGSNVFYDSVIISSSASNAEILAFKLQLSKLCRLSFELFNKI